MNKLTKEYNSISRLMEKLLRVSHSEIKAKLDAEKKAKKRKKSKKSSASRVANDRG